MTTAEAPASLMVFYPLVAAVGGMLFWLGVLSNRVRTLEREAAEGKKNDHDGLAQRDRLTRIESAVEGMATSYAGMQRSMEGVQRQLGNLMAKGTTGGVVHMDGQHG